jgi:hypothetical protein
MARIRKEPPTQELDRDGCASSIPRSYVDHTNFLKVRPGTPPLGVSSSSKRGERSKNERLHVLVQSSAIDRDIERGPGIGLSVAYGQGRRPVMDQRCLNIGCGGQSSYSREGVTEGGK